MLQLVVSALAAYSVWRLTCCFVFQHPFDNIPGPPNKSLVSGNLLQLFEKDAWGFHRSLAENYGGVTRIFGLFRSRWLYIHDPKALQHILLKDQHIFEESAAFLAGHKVVFGDGISSVVGEQHRKQRKTLNPVFSTAHMRNMIPTFFQITHKLRDTFLRQTAEEPKEIEMVGWMTRLSLELICQSGMGMSFDPLTENHTENPFITSVKLLVPTAGSLAPFSILLLPIVHKYNLGTPRFRRFLVNVLPWKALHKMRDIVDTMHNTSLSIFNDKKRALEEGKDTLTGHKDFLSILMRENAKADDEDRMPDNEVLAQISTFMFAAMDTTSSALSRILWLLTTHQDVQAKLRAEIRQAKENYEQPNYDQLAALPYLDAVCRETLRLYPPAPSVLREAREDAVLPFSKPIKGVDGREIQEVRVPKGSKLLISILASNTNTELWGPDSYEWKPERWLSPLHDALAEARIPGVYSHLMTFIGGGRSCIGFKFAQMEIKVVLYTLVDLFQFSLPEKEIFWDMGEIVTPSVDRAQMRPEMPLIISRAT